MSGMARERRAAKSGMMIAAATAEHGHDREHGQPHMHISVRGPVQDPVLGREQSKAVEGKADRRGESRNNDTSTPR